MSELYTIEELPFYSQLVNTEPLTMYGMGELDQSVAKEWGYRTATQWMVVSARDADDMIAYVGIMCNAEGSIVSKEHYVWDVDVDGYDDFISILDEDGAWSDYHLCDYDRLEE